MPNWKISDSVQTFLRQRAERLCGRTLDYAFSDFPLDHEDVQMLAMPRDQVETMRELAKQKVSLPSYADGRFGFQREQLPGLLRGAVIRLKLRKPIYLRKEPDSYMRTLSFAIGAQGYASLNFDREPLPEEKQKALAAWLNRAVRQKRMTEITIAVVRDVVSAHAKTCAHLHRMWPTLATLINDVEGTPYHLSRSSDKLWHDTWKDRLHAVHRPLAIYEPAATVMDQLRPLMKLADTVLAAGMMLTPYDHTQEPIVATVDFWEKLPTDRTFT
jgi:hypothetical protein